MQEKPEGVTEEVAEHLFSFQPRCIECGSTAYLQVHHRIFRSEGEQVLSKFLLETKVTYKQCYNRKLNLWTLHCIQNLCVLCLKCHEGGNGVGVHGGNEKLRQYLRNSFTCPLTGFNVAYSKTKSLF